MVTRRVFFSFHYRPDNWRAGQVRNMGLVEGNALCPTTTGKLLPVVVMLQSKGGLMASCTGGLAPSF